MGKKSDPPPPPNPVTVANAQTGSNVQTAIANSVLGNVNQDTPYGSVSYTNTPSGVSVGGQNIPQLTQTTTLSPNQQTLFGLQEQQGIALGNLGLEQTQNVSDILGQNYDPRRFDTNAVTGGPLDLAGALGNYDSDVESRYRELAQRGLGEDFDRREESLRSRLANQGVNAGTDAFDAELRGLGNQRGDAFARAQLGARQMALSDRQQQVAELTGQRGTNLSEALQQFGLDTSADLAARQNPLNEIIALASGVQTNPIIPGQPRGSNLAGTDVAGIYGQGYQNQLGAWNAQQQQQNAFLGALANLGGAAITYSDRRLKRDVARAGTRYGLPWYRFAYLWDAPGVTREGVMADEAPAHAVSYDADGYALVDYGAL